ncbi:LysR family transcriptional regulator [Lacisediminimonas sp.]|uniref:LysR family transcriptional regulator n=1 Tax=Lacisediminimonas sp. TaxID=3060582 RepID=UPI00271DE8BE|nr:LysR family transcriptional regulator [Lacisediminimonas sp.]MDO8298250.1 LysR family transcriptional regulator [Lacisediminimonas sp.]
MSFKNLDLNLLRVFDVVMSEQNLTRAADRLAMTQPAVSNALKRLRDALGDELLVRTAHGVRATPRAEELWPTVREALVALQAAIAPAVFDLSKVQLTFRLAMADSTATLFLPTLVSAIENEAPGMRVRMVPLTTRDPRALLLSSDIDLAVGSFPGVLSQLAAGQGTLSSTIQHQGLYSGKYVCVMRPGHPLAKVDMTLDRFCEAHHLLVSFSGRGHGMADDQLAKIGRKRTTLLTVHQYFTAGRVIANSDLITILPYHLIAATGMKDALVWKELPISLPEMHVDMLWHERNARNRAHQWLREQILHAVEVSRESTPILTG